MTNADLSFSVEEYQSRLADVRQHMQAKGIDLLILDEVEAMTWVSGYGVSETLWRCCCIPQVGEPFLLVRRLDLAPARERSWFKDVVGFIDWEEPVEALAREIAARGLKADRLGLDFDSHSMPLARFEKLRAALPQSTVVDFGKYVWERRLIKSAAEVDYLRRASAVADQAMERAIAAVRVGGTEREVSAAAAAAYLEHGADDAYVGPITSGTGWDFLHGHLHSHALERGAVVHIELIPKVRGYSARLMRSVVVGAPTAEQEQVARVLAELQDRQIAAMRPGVEAREIDAIVRNGVVESGLREHFDNITGYTLGLYAPTSQRSSDFTRIFHPKSEWVIEPNMAFHMYVSARGLAFSETVLVTDKGAERLTKIARKLYSQG